MKKRIIFIVIALISINAIAEEKEVPVNISFFNHTWAFPLNKMFRISPVYPGISAGTEYIYSSKKNHVFLQTANLGGFINNASGSAFYLNSDFMYRYKPKFGLTTDISFGLGYMQAFHPRTVYKMNDNYEYKKVTDFGKPSFMVCMSMSIGYDLHAKTGLSFSPFIRYQWFASYPYNGIIPIRPHGLLHVGVTYYL